jgi:opacity protein-like surface antigen
MNRTRFAMVLFTFALLTAFTAAASAAPGVGTFEVTGGYAKSSTEVAPAPNETMSGSLTFGAGYFRSIAPTTSWGVEVSYDNLGSTDWNTGTDPATTKVNVLRVTPEFRVNFGAPVGPSFFAQGGLGVYSVSSKIETNDVLFASDGSQTKFGFNVGAGMGFPVGPKTKLNFQGNYHSISTEGTSMNYLGVRAGLGFSL